MFNYLFHFQRDDYRWTLYEARKRDWQGPFLATQTGISDEIKPLLNNSQWRPAISVHLTYERYNHDLTKILQTGACSWPEIKQLCDKAKIKNNPDKINIYEWMFEGETWAMADNKMARLSHQKRQMELSICKQNCDSYLTKKVNILFRQKQIE